jgi:hypothetical protein
VEVRLLPDGRAAAVVVPGREVIAYRDEPPSQVPDRSPILYVLVPVGDRWLIDDLVSLDGFAPAPGSATATPPA